MTTFYIRRGTNPARHTQQSLLGEIFTINDTPMECTRVKEAFISGKHVACIEFERIQHEAFALVGAGLRSGNPFAGVWTNASSDSLEADGWRPADPAAAIAFLHGK